MERRLSADARWPRARRGRTLVAALLAALVLTQSLAAQSLAAQSLLAQPAAPCARALVERACLAGATFAPRAAATPRAPAGDWEDVRRSTVNGIKWGAIIGAVAGAAGCALDDECRDPEDGGGGASAIFETAVFAGAAGAAFGALIGAIVGAVR